MPTEYSLSDVLERLYQNQLALEAAVIELTLRVEHQGATDIGDNVHGALHSIGENAAHIQQGLAKLTAQGPHQSSGPDNPPVTAFLDFERMHSEASTRCSARRMTPYDTVRQIQIPNYVFAEKMA